MKQHKMASGNVLTDSDFDELLVQVEDGVLQPSKWKRAPGRPSLSGKSTTSPTVRIRVSPEIKEALQQEAALRKTTVSDVVRGAVMRHIAKGKAKKGAF